MGHPTFIIHDISQGFMVAHKAEISKKLTLLYSNCGAGRSIGPEVFSEMVTQIQKKYKKAKIVAILDCGNEAGTVLSAIQQGIQHIHFNLSQKKKFKITQIAKANGIQIHNAPINAINLNEISNDQELAKEINRL